MSTHPDLRDAIDRYGPDFGAWPDAALANSARAAVLADRGLRRARDNAAALATGLDLARGDLDREIAASGAVDRVMEAVLAAIPSPAARRRWIAVAAGLVVAAGLGSLADLRILAPSENRNLEVVTLDPLVFGPTAGDTR